MESIKLGDKVQVLGKNVNGEVVFVGETHFSDGLWYGIILDEAKGRHNGSIEGIRYFKSPRNRGVFVRACQIQKVCSNSSDMSYKKPNYLRSKITAKSNNNGKAKLQLSNRDHKIMKESVLNANDCNSELQAVKSENEQLKEKLKSADQTLEDSLNEYSNTLNEMRNLKDEINSKKKQIKVQKSLIKFLSLRQCNHFGKHSPDATNKNATQTIQDKPVTEEPVLSDELSSSDDEFDLKNSKTLASMQRVVELEEHNRIMIQGLVELREFLKSKCQPQFSSSDSSIKDNQGYLENKSSRTGSFAGVKDPAAVHKTSDFLPTVTSSNLREFIETLCEGRIYSTILKEKARWRNEDGGQNFNSKSTNNVCLASNTDVLVDNLNGNNVASNYAQHVSNGIQSVVPGSTFQSDDKNFLVSKSNDLKNYVEVTEISQQNDEATRMQNLEDKMRPKTTTAKDSKKLMSAIRLKTNEDTHQWDAPLMRESYITEGHDYNTLSEKSPSHSHFQFVFPDQSTELALQSGGDSVFLSSKDEQTKIIAGNLAKCIINN